MVRNMKVSMKLSEESEITKEENMKSISISPLKTTLHSDNITIELTEFELVNLLMAVAQGYTRIIYEMLGIDFGIGDDASNNPK